jgi:PEP-CTERM motif-containing protein
MLATRKLCRNSFFVALLSGALGSVAALGAHAAPVQWTAGNGHWYEALPGTTTWDAAFAAAAARIHMGMPGHLATITSAGENLFISALSPNPGFAAGPFILGGFQDPGATTFDGGWNWVTAEPFDYTNWNPFGVQEPNDGDDGSEAVGTGDEDKLHFRGDFFVNADGLTWNDYPGGITGGYVVEYEAITVIPEPETYAMLIAGLGLLGFWGRRRRTP